MGPCVRVARRASGFLLSTRFQNIHGNSCRLRRYMSYRAHPPQAVVRRFRRGLTLPLRDPVMQEVPTPPRCAGCSFSSLQSWKLESSSSDIDRRTYRLSALTTRYAGRVVDVSTAVRERSSSRQALYAVVVASMKTAAPAASSTFTNGGALSARRLSVVAAANAAFRKMTRTTCCSEATRARAVHRSGRGWYRSSRRTEMMPSRRAPALPSPYRGR